MDSAEAAAAAGLLTDDLIVEILSRLPARSVHRFKCVCKLWRDLIAYPAHRKRLPQTLAGFLYSTHTGVYGHHLAAVSSTVVDFVDPSLSFLRPMNYTKIRLRDTCNGLLLCVCYYNMEKRLVVCNPATQRWTELPPAPQPQPGTYNWDQRLAFDPAVSPSHFHVLDFVDTTNKYHHTGVNIYSSRTGAWIHRDTELLDKVVLADGSVFVGGVLHLPGKLREDRPCQSRHSIGYSYQENFVLVVVDMEWKAWKIVRTPAYGFSFGAIGWSQGRLHYATPSETPITVSNDDDEVILREIAVWCLEDYGSKKWALKHIVRIDKPIEMEYSVVGFHPDCDTIFFVTTTRAAYHSDSWDASSLASWDMWRLQFRTVLDLEKRSSVTYLPYVPMFSESTLPDGEVQ